jgi:predicted nucleic acid-binding protein
MTPLVVDASVVIKWCFPEVLGEAALALLDEQRTYLAPDFLFAETANAIRKRVQRREIAIEDGTNLIAEIDRMAIQTVSSRELAGPAYKIAAMHGRSVYDAMYIALAMERKTRLITADERLFNAVSGVRDIAPHIRFLRDYSL